MAPDTSGTNCGFEVVPFTVKGMVNADFPPPLFAAENGSHTSDRASRRHYLCHHLAIKLLARADRSISGNGSNRGTTRFTLFACSLADPRANSR